MKRSVSFINPTIFDTASKRQRSDSLDTHPGSGQDTYGVQCCKCPASDEYECLQDAYDYGWFYFDGSDYCPAHAEEGIYEEEQYTEDLYIRKEVSAFLNDLILYKL